MTKKMAKYKTIYIIYENKIKPLFDDLAKNPALTKEAVVYFLKQGCCCWYSVSEKIREDYLYDQDPISCKFRTEWYSYSGYRC